MNPVVIIPALNPDEKLILLVEELQKQDLHTIVVDDGSGAEYAAIFELLKIKYACDICTHPSNCGKGRALKTGIRFLLDKYPESPGFVTADADGQHAVRNISEIAGLLSGNHSGIATLAVASFLNGVLEIAGTDSVYLLYFYIIGFALVFLGSLPLLSSASKGLSESN